MGIMDRLRGRKKTQDRAPIPQPPRTRQGFDDEIIDVAHRAVPRSQELTHFFVVSANPSLIEAYHELFRVGAPAYGGEAHLYRAQRATLEAREPGAADNGLPFAGRSVMGSTEAELPTVADALKAVAIEAFRGEAFVAYVAVGQKGTPWVREVYTTLLGEAVKQGILPFHMFTTTDEDAAAFLRESFTAMSPL